MQTLLKPTSLSLDFESDWDLDSVPLNVWAAIWSPVLDIKVLHPRHEEGVNFIETVAHGGLAGARFATGYELFQHARRKLTSGAGVIAVQRIVSGYSAMEFELKTFVHRPGFITITDHLHEFRGSHHEAIGETIFIPRHLLGLPEQSPVGPIMIPTESIHGELLETELQRYFERSENGADIGAAFNIDTFLHTTSSVIGFHRHPTSERAGWWRARNDLIRKYIDSHLGDQTLLPAQICNLFNLSRATLYRMFEADGGVRRFIQDRRLHSAVWDLAEGGIQRGRLTQVADKWGFSSNANFNRAVKVAFGMPPGALLHPLSFIAPASIDDTKQFFPLLDWLTELNLEPSGRPHFF